MLNSWLGILTLVHLYIVNLSFHMRKSLGSLPSPKFPATCCTHRAWLADLVSFFPAWRPWTQYSCIDLRESKQKLWNSWGITNCVTTLWVRNTCCSFVVFYFKICSPKKVAQLLKWPLPSSWFTLDAGHYMTNPNYAQLRGSPSKLP